MEATESSKRKRKNINYSELENGVDLEQLNDNSNKRHQKTTGKNDKSPTEKAKTVQSKKRNRKTTNKSKVGKSKSSEKIDEINSYQSIGKKGQHANSICNSANNNAEKTNEMSITDIIESGNNSNDQNIEPRRKRGRIKKFTLVYSDNEMSLCMVCKTNVDNSVWFDHKEKVHGNLAWREHEEPLIDDEKILKSLKESKDQLGYLRCNKCDIDTSNVQTFKDHLEFCNGIVNSKGLITCAVCEMDMEKSLWQYHKYRKHNNLAWRKGDVPLNLENRLLVIQILNLLYKARKPLHCEKCDAVKKSVNGYLSHKDTCQKTDEELEKVKASCSICGKKVLPVSMDAHMKSHTRYTEQLDSAKKSNNYFNVDVDISGDKRKSAKKAMKILENIKEEHPEVSSKYYITKRDANEDFFKNKFEKILKKHNTLNCIFKNCDFSTNSVDSIISHLNLCDKKVDQYVLCKLCFSLHKDKNEVLKHMKQHHQKIFKDDLDFNVNDTDDNISEQENEVDYDNKTTKKKNVKPNKAKSSGTVIKPAFLNRPMRENHSSFLYNHAYFWMKIFCNTNYNTLSLYPSLRKNQPWKLLHYDLFDTYLPKYEQSCDVAARQIKYSDKRNNEHEWNFKNLELLEVGELYEGDKTIFCGGPISALAWLPTPHLHHNNKQILAVTVLNDGDTKYSTIRNYAEPTVIQFWDFGCLTYHLTNLPKTSLLFGLAINEGPIWHLEWCPSGCMDDSSSNDDSNRRLGLLGVATSDSLVHIYDIDNVDESQYGQFYKGDPILKLHFGGKEKEAFYATRISWTKAAGHKYIAVGYTNGMVALYNLESNSPSLKSQKDGTNTVNMLPYYRFKAHLSHITVLTLHNLNGGNRWLLTSSFDKVACFWDLLTGKQITSHKRYSSSDGVWMTLWPTCVLAEENSTLKMKSHTYLKSLRDAMNESGSLTSALAGIKCLSFSDWLNAIIHGSFSGDIIAQFCHRLLYNVNSKELKRSARCVFSTCKLIKKTECYEQGTVKYGESIKKFGLVFEDYKTDRIRDFPCSRSPQFNINDFDNKENDVEEYNLRGVNKIMFNENRQAFTYYVTGHQAGFIRLQRLNFFTSTLNEITKTSRSKDQ